MDGEVIEELKTYVVPIEGLLTPRIFAIGKVTIYPSTDDLLFVEALDRSELFNEWIRKPADKYRAVAVVSSNSIEIALDHIRVALQIFRVFQYGMMQVDLYSHFGLPGEINPESIKYFYKGRSNSLTTYYDTGLGLGFELLENGIQSWENSAQSLQMAALAINNEVASEGAKRALNGIKLFSQSILTKDPDLQVFLIIAALDGMTKIVDKESKRYIFARKMSYLSCWKSGRCGALSGHRCDYVLCDPHNNADRGKLKELENSLNLSDSRICTIWAIANNWYKSRSATAHGQPEGIIPSESSAFAFWAYHQYIGPVLAWLSDHPDTPIEELEAEIKFLTSRRLD